MSEGHSTETPSGFIWKYQYKHIVPLKADQVQQPKPASHQDVNSDLLDQRLYKYLYLSIAIHERSIQCHPRTDLL